jgi:hypothetical protein
VVRSSRRASSSSSTTPGNSSRRAGGASRSMPAPSTLAETLRAKGVIAVDDKG